MERTLIIFKPDAVSRHLVGELLTRFERKGFQIEEIKSFRFTEELARLHYPEHSTRDYFPKILDYLVSGLSIAIVLSGPDAVAIARRMVGPTNGAEAAAGTIRGDYAIGYRQNVIHASDSPESAQRELKLFFGKEFS